MRILLFSEITLFKYNVSTILSPIVACSQALYFSLDIVEGAYGKKNREGFIEGGLGWGKRENSSSFFSHSNSLSRANEASTLSNCRKKKKTFCEHAMFNHSYLQSFFEEEVSKIAMLISVKTNGIPNPPKPTDPLPPSAFFSFAKVHCCS